MDRDDLENPSDFHPLFPVQDLTTLLFRWELRPYTKKLHNILRNRSFHPATAIEGLGILVVFVSGRGVDIRKEMTMMTMKCETLRLQGAYPHGLSIS